jgi:hypothetical protein
LSIVFDVTDVMAPNACLLIVVSQKLDIYVCRR